VIYCIYNVKEGVGMLQRLLSVQILKRYIVYLIVYPCYMSIYSFPNIIVTIYPFPVILEHFVSNPDAA
jgi:hypothetical protein